jgi:DNA mismatch repair protein MutL
MIRILPPDEAKKIAAGEVIDRPAALVRELIDNAIDAGAKNIELSIEGGGINKIEVIDDGSGMGREDLLLCTKTHATSKIQSLDDLAHFTTLGFRGEALAAAAAVASLEIVSSADGREAWLFETETGTLTQTRRKRGTSVRSFGLFDSIPARKRFLKREASEAALCRQVFIEKALAFPGICFRFIHENQLKLNIQSCNDEGAPVLQKRFGELVPGSHERNFLHTAEASGAGFTVTIVFGGPELFRRDRRQQFVFANKRRIQDFGMLQAFEFGLPGFFPNNSHPLGAVFIEIDPARADFNIHPAKREVRFADAGTIHHSIVTVLRNYIESKNLESREAGGESYYSGLGGNKEKTELSEFNFGSLLAVKALREKEETFAAEKKPAYELTEHLTAGAGKPGQKPKLAGRIFDLFILAEHDDRLFIIDQHAAHERLLYDRFLSAPPPSQKLLVPVPFTAETEEDDQFLRAKKEELAALGIALESEGNGAWCIEAFPESWKTGDMAGEILALRNGGKSLAESCAASFACRSAVKDGDFLDDEGSLALAEAALALRGETGALPRCPHGRPLWTEISREELFKAVRRSR